MDRKYELLKDDCINYCGKTLYRIKALRNFGGIEVGDIGGYIQSEDNLSHEHNCWVYKHAKVFWDAKVYENAEVFGNAQVFGDVRVYENAQIYGNAEVYGSSKICGNAIVSGNVVVFGNAKLFGNAKIFENAEVYGSAVINKGTITGRVSMPYKDIFQHRCENRMLTAILTEDDQILYSIGCQHKITEEEFIDRIHNKDGGLKENPHRAEYLRLIKTINFHFKEKLNN